MDVDRKLTEEQVPGPQLLKDKEKGRPTKTACSITTLARNEQLG